MFRFDIRVSHIDIVSVPALLDEEGTEEEEVESESNSDDGEDNREDNSCVVREGYHMSRIEKGENRR